MITSIQVNAQSVELENAVSQKVMVAMRYRNNYSLGDVPFYARPGVQLRGAPLMKYQGEHVRKPGAGFEMDFAASQDDFEFYSTFGSSWFR